MDPRERHDRLLRLADVEEDSTFAPMRPKVRAPKERTNKRTGRVVKNGHPYPREDPRSHGR